MDTECRTSAFEYFVMSIKFNFLNLIMKLNLCYREFSFFEFSIHFMLFCVNFGRKYRISVLLFFIGTGIIRLLFGVFIFAFVRESSRKLQTGVFIMFSFLFILVYIYLQVFAIPIWRQLHDEIFNNDVISRIKNYVSKLMYLIYFGIGLPILVCSCVREYIYAADVLSVNEPERWILRVPVLNASEVEFCQRYFGDFCTHVASFQHASVYKIALIFAISIMVTVYGFCHCINITLAAFLRTQVFFFSEHLKEIEEKAERIGTQIDKREENNYRIARKQLLQYDSYVEESFRSLNKELQKIHRFVSPSFMETSF